MKKQGKQAANLALVLHRRRVFDRGHEAHDRLVKDARHVLEFRAVVAVYNEKQRFSSEWYEICWMQAVHRRRADVMVVRIGKMLGIGRCLLIVCIASVGGSIGRSSVV